MFSLLGKPWKALYTFHSLISPFSGETTPPSSSFTPHVWQTGGPEELWREINSSKQTGVDVSLD